MFPSFHDQTRDEEREKLDQIKHFNLHSEVSIENSKNIFTISSSKKKALQNKRYRLTQWFPQYAPRICDQFPGDPQIRSWVQNFPAWPTF